MTAALTTTTIKQILRAHGVKYPVKYFKGLASTKNVRSRIQKIKNDTYEPFPTDAGIKTKTSRHTRTFYRIFGTKAKSLAQKARATGVPLSVIKAVYRRGLAAWKSGHRPGATQSQWAFARVHSFLTLGKTTLSSDLDQFIKIPRAQKIAWISQLRDQRRRPR